jgi:hypothetical protein
MEECMSKRSGPNIVLVLLVLFAGAQATAQTASSEAPYASTVVVTGLVTSYEARSGLVTIGDVTVFVGDLVVGLDVSISQGDELLLVGTDVDGTGFVWASALEFLNRTAAQSITGTGKKSITGTGRQSITGTGKQSITGTGKQSITGTGTSLQSITGTGKSAQSITGTGKASITGTGSR